MILSPTDSTAVRGFLAPAVEPLVIDNLYLVVYVAGAAFYATELNSKELLWSVTNSEAMKMARRN
jgi:hypothetical protein